MPTTITRILKLRDKVCAHKPNRVKPEEFRVYLVAHSMGGLVCRAFLQNPKLGDPAARQAVDKVFTYATPHNGIDVQLIGNVPNWASFHNLNDFNRGRIGEYLNLKDEVKKSDDAAVVKNFDPNRIFNLVGTNARDLNLIEAFGLGSGPCSLCRQKCAFDGGCRHAEQARPGMEACGIDVFATARANGFEIEVVRDEGRVEPGDLRG